MSLIDDARRLAESNPVQDVGYEMTVNRCPFCCVENGPHADDCEWLAMPRILAVLEAAERIVEIERDKYPRRFLPEGHVLLDLAGALYGRPTAIVTQVAPSPGSGSV